ncbi:MAG: flagellar motor protein MotB [bacterium]
MRFAPTATLAISGLTLIALGGCVPQNQYDDLMSAYRSKEQQLLQMQNDYQTARANEDMLRKQLAEAAADLAAAKNMVGGDRGALEELEKRYQSLLAQLGSMSPLPESVNEVLEKLAADYPDIFEFDARLGMLRFKSDVTFDLGSAKLTSKAETVLKKFAEILNQGEARNLEVRVVGHTDNVAIRRAATVAQHPTNVHLSAHRSISVRDALVGDGVGSNRFMVAGYGEFRPIVENTTKGNAENRRVEVFLVPMPSGVMAAGSSNSTPAKSTGTGTQTATGAEEANEK